MKRNRVFALLMSVLLLVTALLSGCGANKLQQGQEGADVETVPETTSETSYQQGLKRADVEAFPVATSEMSYADRRQLAIDFFELQLTFHWISNMEISDYWMSYGEGKKTIFTTSVYGGVPYQSKGTGNLYRWLEYYNEKTGVMDFERALAENGGYGEGAAMIDEGTKDNPKYKKYRSLMTFFNQCSIGSFWGWGRVINSTNFNSTSYMTLTNGFIPVGYTYPDMDKIDKFGVKTENNPQKYDTKNVISDWVDLHGRDAMYKCYAQTRPGDLLVSGGHTLMVKEVKVKTLPDGTIDSKNSKLIVLEQTEAWRDVQAYEGAPLIYQGYWDASYSFEKLQNKDYIPFTFAEFLDPNVAEDKALLDIYHAYTDVTAPVARRYKLFTFTKEELMKMSGPDVEKAQVFTNLPEGLKDITVAQLDEMNLGSNYPISDVFVTVKNKQGKVLHQNVYRAMLGEIREMSMKENNSTWTKDANGHYLTMTDKVAQFADGENVVEISVQLSTGEKPVVFSGTLLA